MKDVFNQQCQRHRKATWQNVDRGWQGIREARKGSEKERQGKAKATRAEPNKPETELVELEVVDAVNMDQAICVVERQLTQALQGSQA